MSKLDDAMDDLVRERKSIASDALRYRWLRKHLVNWCPDDDTARLSWHAREALDAEIDAAMNGANDVLSRAAMTTDIAEE